MRSNETELLVYPDADHQKTDELFDTRGHWRKNERPARWGNPEASLEDQHFWRVFDSCLNHLPAQQARIFMIREFIGLNSKKIFETLSITESNLSSCL